MSNDRLRRWTSPLDFADALWRQSPRIDVAVDPRTSGGIQLLGKPFTIDELAAKMREVLDRPAID